MKSNSIDQLMQISNNHRKLASMIPDLPQEFTLLISKGYQYNLSQLILLYEQVSENEKLLLFWFSLLLIRLKSESPVNDGNALLYSTFIFDFAKSDPINIDIILYEYANPLNLEIAVSKPDFLYHWAHGLFVFADNPFLVSPISYLVVRLKIESLNLLSLYSEVQNADYVEEIVRMIQCIPLLKQEFNEFLDEIAQRILTVIIGINDLDGVKSLLGQNCKPDLPQTIKAIEIITPLEEHLNKKNNKLLNKIKDYINSKSRKKKEIPKQPLIPSKNINEISYDRNPIYGHTFKDFSVTIIRGMNSDGTRLILKQYNFFSENFDTSKINNEIKILTFLSNKKQSFKNVLELYFVDIKNTKISIWMEDGGKSLMDYITELKSKQEFISQDIIERWIEELIVCFALMNNHGINHCDIKPHNLLVNENDMSIKIIDFNISQITGEIQSSMLVTQLLPIQGTDGYMAPELEQALRDNLKETFYKPGKSDVFSLGLTFLQMITLEKLTSFNMKENHHLLMRKVDGLRCKDWIIMLLKHMLEIDRQKRFSFNKLVKFIKVDGPTVIIN